MKILFLTILTLASCKPVETLPARVSSTPEPAFFDPVPGETWVFEGSVRKLKKGATLPVLPELIKSTRSRYTRRFEGRTRIPGFKEEVLHFTRREEEEVVENLYFTLDSRTLAMVASASRGGELVVFAERVVILTADAEPGETWLGAGRSVSQVMAREPVSTRLGIMPALKVKWEKQGSESRQPLIYYWFSPGLGFVREDSFVYNRNTLLSEESSVLVSHLRPGK